MKVSKQTMARLLAWKPMSEAEKVQIGLYKIRQMTNQTNQRQLGKIPVVTITPNIPSHRVINEPVDIEHRFGFASRSVTNEPIGNRERRYGFASHQEKSIMEKFNFNGALPGRDKIRPQEQRHQFVGLEKFGFVGERRRSNTDGFLK